MMPIFTHQNNPEKSTSNVDFQLIGITSEKVLQNDINFLLIEITSKKYIEMMWKLANVILFVVST